MATGSIPVTNIRDHLTLVNPSYQAFQILHWGFVAVPAITGIDKFSHLLVNWELYLSPALSRFLPFSSHAFLQIVGGIEIATAITVALKPRIGSYVVMVWLWAIVLNLLSIPGFYDVALRDFGLSMGALALARLSQNFDRQHL